MGHLSLRSNQDIYDEPLLPTAVEIGDMDLLAEILLNPNLPTFVTDRGTVAFVTEGQSGALGLAAAAALLGWRASAGRRRVRAAALA